MNKPDEGLLYPYPIDFCGPVDNARGLLIFNRSSTNPSVIFTVLFRWWRLHGRWVIIPDDQLDTFSNSRAVALSILDQCLFVDHVVARRKGLVAMFYSSKEHRLDKGVKIHAAFKNVPLPV